MHFQSEPDLVDEGWWSEPDEGGGDASGWGSPVLASAPLLAVISFVNVSFPSVLCFCHF